MSEANKAILRGLYEAFNSGDFSRVSELVAPNMHDHEGLPGVDTNGPEGFKRVVTAFRSAFPDLKATIEQQVADGDLVVFHFRMTGTHRGEFMGIPATGKSFDVTGFDMIRVEGGKAVEHWGQSDQVGMMMQLGVMSAPA
ncbi:MAG TPA: ester cyclase [Dehalococcoidia bacterium]|jgi:steroid delta-isomerase-like uncharacterized protein